MPSSNLDDLMRFYRFLLRFQSVDRVIRIPGTDSFENDVEHSFSLAMMAWYIISTHHLGLDVDKAMRYALVHDLVEVYAGDTPAFSPDPQEHATKHFRESKSLEQIQHEFGHFPELAQAITAYEARLDLESQFVYELDKLVPMITVYLDSGQNYRVNNIGFRKLVDDRRAKITSSAQLREYLESLIELLQVDPELFPPDEPPKK